VAGCAGIFHEAALGSVPRSGEGAGAEPRRDVTGTVVVLEAARAAGVKRVVFAASSSAYGERAKAPSTRGWSLADQPVRGQQGFLRAYLQAYAAPTAWETLCCATSTSSGPYQESGRALTRRLSPPG